MRKKIIALVCVAIVSMSLTACGNNTASATFTTEYSNGSQNQPSNTVVEPTENPANVDNSGHEPESYQSGNFQDYREGDDFFDIEAFALDNGCDYVLWADDNGETSKASATRVILFYGDWEIYVNEGHWLYAQNHNTNTEYNMVPSGDSSLVSICKENNIKIGTDSCQYLNEILDNIKGSN